MLYWEKRSLPVAILDNYIATHSDIASQPLSCLLSIGPKACDDKVLSENEQNESLIDRAVAAVGSGRPETRSDDVLPVPISHAIRLSAVVSTLSTQANNIEPKVSLRNLWKNILSNLGKKLCTREKFTLSVFHSLNNAKE
jgi:hypothetical protein